MSKEFKDTGEPNPHLAAFETINYEARSARMFQIKDMGGVFESLEGIYLPPVGLRSNGSWSNIFVTEPYKSPDDRILAWGRFYTINEYYDGTFGLLRQLQMHYHQSTIQENYWKIDDEFSKTPQGTYILKDSNGLTPFIITKPDGSERASIPKYRPELFHAPEQDKAEVVLNELTYAASFFTEKRRQHDEVAADAEWKYGLDETEMRQLHKGWQIEQGPYCLERTFEPFAYKRELQSRYTR